MLRIALFLSMFLVLSPLQAQDYQAGSANKAYRLLEADTIYPAKTLYENIKSSQQFTVMSKIFELTNAQDEIDKLGMVTVFLPSDAAFAAYDDKALDKLLSAANVDALKKALMSHIIIGRVDKNSLQRNLQQNSGSAFFRSPADADPEFLQQDTALLITVPGAPKAQITHTNYYHKNGYLHIVDKFLLPDD